jgi:hypothetical protein
MRCGASVKTTAVERDRAIEIVRARRDLVDAHHVDRHVVLLGRIASR